MSIQRQFFFAYQTIYGSFILKNIKVTAEIRTRNNMKKEVVGGLLMKPCQQTPIHLRNYEVFIVIECC